MWIFQYTLALVKEMLAYVRGKYTTVPIPGAEVTLNHPATNHYPSRNSFA